MPIVFGMKVLSNEMRGQVQRAIHQAVRDERVKVAHQVETDWKARAPVDTGGYRDSIHTIDDATKTTSVVTTDVPGPDPYDIYQEYGTVDDAPQPSARPAAEQSREPFKGRVAQALARVTS